MRCERTRSRAGAGAGPSFRVNRQKSVTGRPEGREARQQETNRGLSARPWGSDPRQVHNKEQEKLLQSGSHSRLTTLEPLCFTPGRALILSDPAPYRKQMRLDYTRLHLHFYHPAVKSKSKHSHRHPS